MKLGSLFDGIGGFPLSAAMCGIEPIWASEIEPFPILVTHKRFPDMKHLGSVTDINGAEVEPVDIITFGSPCQDLSVAGKQAGIHEGARSNLFFEAVRIIKEMRQKDEATGRSGVDVRPRYAVWENVPGAFSSHGGADFQAVLQALAEVADPDVSVPLCEKGKWQKAGCIVGNDWSIAWCVYDAQYWGVPQRRKRIYLVADFVSERAGEILFKPESMRGDSSQGGTTWQRASSDAQGGADGGCGGVGVFMGGQGAKARGIAYREEVSPALKSSLSGGNTAPDVIYACHQNTGQGWCTDLVAERKPRKYIVRRLTPLECCRLQGCPDGWTEDLAIPDPTIEEVEFFTNVWAVWAEINGTNPKSLNQVIKWLADPQSDSAEYKAYGNSLAIPCSYDVIRRISE